MAPLRLHIGSTLDHMVGGVGLASLVKESPYKALSCLEESKALASALMHVLSEGIKLAMGLFSRLQAVFWLEEMQDWLFLCFLSKSTTVRALPSNSLEFFGSEAAALFSASDKEKQQDALVQMAVVPSSLPAQRGGAFGDRLAFRPKSVSRLLPSRPSQSQPQPPPCPSSFYSEKKGLLHGQGWTASNRQHPQ